jgi:hypothetical protein
MRTNGAPSVLSAGRRSNFVTSLVRLRQYADGRVVIDGHGLNPAKLAEVAALLADRAVAALPLGDPQAPPLLDDQVGGPAPPTAPAVELPPADPGEFLAARTERVFAGWISARAMRSSYLAWAAERQLSAIGRTPFCQALTGAGLRYVRRRPNGAKQERGFAGARLRTDRVAQLLLIAP